MTSNDISRIDNRFGQISDSLLSPGTAFQGSIVKSARRTIELFEFFAEHQSPANVLSISGALAYPASSTAALLKSLVAMGYLHHDTATKTYFPTLRLTMLGAWLQQQYFQKSDLMGLLHAVAREAGGVAVLGMQSGIHVQYLMAVDAENKDIRAYWRIGSLRPICRSATGKMLLTLVTPQALKAIALHANSLEREASHRVKLKDLAREIEVCRTLGYAISDGSVTPGRALVAVLLPTLPNHTPLALAVGGPVEHVKSQAKNWLEVLRRHVARYSAGDY